MSDESPFYTVKEVMRLLRVELMTVRRWISSRAIPSQRRPVPGRPPMRMIPRFAIPERAEGSLTVGEAAAKFGLSTSIVRRYCVAGKLDAFKLVAARNTDWRVRATATIPAFEPGRRRRKWRRAVSAPY